MRIELVCSHCSKPLEIKTSAINVTHDAIVFDVVTCVDCLDNVEAASYDSGVESVTGKEPD